MLQERQRTVRGPHLFDIAVESRSYARNSRSRNDRIDLWRLDDSNADETIRDAETLDDRFRCIHAEEEDMRDRVSEVVKGSSNHRSDHYRLPS